MGLFRCLRENRPALQSLSVLAFPVLFRFVYEKAICDASERAAQLLAPLTWGLTAETSEHAGGQGSPLSDDCFLLALIDQWHNGQISRGPLFHQPKYLTETSEQPNDFCMTLCNCCSIEKSNINPQRGLLRIA